MSSALASFLRFTWKVALTLTAVGCGCYVARRTPFSPLRMSKYIAELRCRARAQVDDTTRTIEALRAQLREEGERARLEVERMVEVAGFWRRMENLARDEIWRRGAELGQADARFRGQDEHLRSLQSQVSALRLEAADRESSFAQERKRLQAESDAREVEFREARQSSIPADTLSDSDVVRMVEELNLEIAGLATHLTDTFQADEHRGGEAATAAYERTQQSISPVLAELLESIQHQDDPILVQIALQADMTSFAAGMISAWDFQHQSNAVFSGIHKQMLKSESQAVAGRWRAMTRQYSKQRLYNGRDLTAGFAHQLADRLSDLLLIAGSSVTGEHLRNTSTQSLASIVRLSLDLQRVIGEEIIACDYEIVVARVGDLFEPQQMVDAYSADEGAAGVDESSELHVLCTAELGLRRCEKVDDLDPTDQIRTTVLMKPRVVLETLVYELGLVEEEETVVNEQ